jgi:DNA polymerase III subunit delta'
VSDQSIWEMVVGHDEAVAVLREVVAGERVTHAWLFTGPPGIGKLHTARVFAAALNCPAGGDGTCDSCRRILRGVHPDVHLIVPEGDNLLVEDVRAVREEASRTHYEAPTAVFILDEADRLTEAAANAPGGVRAGRPQRRGPGRHRALPRPHPAVREPLPG